MERHKNLERGTVGGRDTVTGFTSSELSAAVADAIAAMSKPDDVPPGWFTIRQIAEEVQRGRLLTGKGCWSRKLASQLVDGKEVKTFRVLNGKRGLYPVEHYKL